MLDVCLSTVKIKMFITGTDNDYNTTPYHPPPVNQIASTNHPPSIFIPTTHHPPVEYNPYNPQQDQHPFSPPVYPQVAPAHYPLHHQTPYLIYPPAMHSNYPHPQFTMNNNVVSYDSSAIYTTQPTCNMTGGGYEHVTHYAPPPNTYSGGAAANYIHSPPLPQHTYVTHVVPTPIVGQENGLMGKSVKPIAGRVRKSANLEQKQPVQRKSDVERKPEQKTVNLEQKPVNVDQPRGLEHKQMNNKEHDLVNSEQKPIEKELLVNSEHKPVNVRKSTGTEHKPVNQVVNLEQEPVDLIQNAVNLEQCQIDPAPKPVNLERKPVNPEQRQANLKQRQVNSEQKPVNVDTKPENPVVNLEQGSGNSSENAVKPVGKSWASLFNKSPAGGAAIAAANPNETNGNGERSPLAKAVNKETNNNEEEACPIRHPKKSHFADPNCYRLGGMYFEPFLLKPEIVNC